MCLRGLKRNNVYDSDPSALTLCGPVQTTSCLYNPEKKLILGDKWVQNIAPELQRVKNQIFFRLFETSLRI